MQFLEAILLPLVFVSSSFSTRPVYPSKYRGVLSALCCIVMLSYGLSFARNLHSKVVMLYMLIIIPAVMGIVPIEEKMKAVLSYTRVWGLSWVFLALMQGDITKAELYMRFESNLVKLQHQFTNINIILNQVLFCLLAKAVSCPQLTCYNIFWQYLSIIAVIHFFEKITWKAMLLLLASPLLLNIRPGCHFTIVVATVYIMLTTFSGDICGGRTQRWAGFLRVLQFPLPFIPSLLHLHISSVPPSVVPLVVRTGIKHYQISNAFVGVPGQDSRTISAIRKWKIAALGGAEEYWIPLLMRAFSALLSAVLTIAALYDRSSWKLCVWVWYSNVFVYILYTMEWYWPPLGQQREHVRRYPTMDRQARDWTGPCSICLEQIKPCTATAIPCGHIFHGECLEKSLEVNTNICPLCRWPVSSVPSL